MLNNAQQGQRKDAPHDAQEPNLWLKLGPDVHELLYQLFAGALLLVIVFGLAWLSFEAAAPKPVQVKATWLTHASTTGASHAP